MSTQAERDQQLVERVTALYDQMKKPIFVWSMANGRLQTLLIQGVPEDDPRVRGARTSLIKAAKQIDAAVQQYKTRRPRPDVEIL